MKFLIRNSKNAINKNKHLDSVTSVTKNSVTLSKPHQQNNL